MEEENIYCLFCRNQSNSTLVKVPLTQFVSYPSQNKTQRLAVLKLQLESEDHSLNEKLLNRLAEFTDGFSSNELEELCRDAAGIRLEELCLENSDALLVPTTFVNIRLLHAEG